MISSRRFSVIVRLVLLVSFLLPVTLASKTLAQDASPVAAADLRVGTTPDLAAMPITPADLVAVGLPGFGRFFNGFYNDLDQFVEGTAGFYEQPVAETSAVFDRMGLRRMYGSGMGQPSVPDNAESPPARGAYTNLFEIANASEADAFFTYIEEASVAPDAPFVAVDAPFALGDRAMIVNYSSLDPEMGGQYFEYALIVRIGNLFFDTGLWTTVPEGTATPVATAVAQDAALASPAGTVADLETLGRRQLARIEAVVAGGSPNLPGLLLRVGDDPLAATDDYTEGYRLLDGELLPYYADRDDDLIADPAALTGAIAAYELEESFQRGDEFVPGDFYLLNRLYTFPDEETAAAFLASRPEELASGGFALVSDAAPESRSDLLPGKATDLGDESLALSFVRAFDDGTQAVGFEVFVRVGATVAAVSLEGPPDMPLALVANIAAAQAACLEAGACPDALPVPEPFLAVKEAAPAAATPAAQDATPEASAADNEDFAGLVDIGGRSLYLRCSGEGSPTVILEAGGNGTPSGTWWADSTVQAGIAEYTRVCSYDRANTYGRSDPAPLPRAGTEIVNDLHALLDAANVPVPYVMVAASTGGLISRLYASLYPDEVAGIVLLDTVHEDLDARYSEILSYDLFRAYAEMSGNDVDPEGIWIQGYLSDAIEYEVMSAQVASPIRPMPLVVITIDNAFVPSDFPPGWPADADNAMWRALQQAQADLVPGGQLIVAENSSHNIHFDQPQVVIDTVRDVVEAVRDPGTWEMPAASP